MTAVCLQKPEVVISQALIDRSFRNLVRYTDILRFSTSVNELRLQTQNVFALQLDFDIRVRVALVVSFNKIRYTNAGIW